MFKDVDGKIHKYCLSHLANRFLAAAVKKFHYFPSHLKKNFDAFQVFLMQKKKVAKRVSNMQYT